MISLNYCIEKNIYKIYIMLVVVTKEVITVFFMLVLFTLIYPFITDTSKKILPKSLMPMLQLMSILAVFLTFVFLVNYNNILDTINIEYAQAIKNISNY